VLCKNNFTYLAKQLHEYVGLVDKVSGYLAS